MTAPVMDRRPTRTSLLPSGSSALEKLIDEQCPDWNNLLATVQADSAHTGNHPSHKPWLAAEWGLSPFADQFDSLDALLEAGVPWLLERGSAAAVRRVLGWLGYTTNVVLEEEGPYLHIDLGRVASAEELEVVARLVRHSIPLHVHFYRVYHGWDLRALRLDGGQPLDQAMLDTDSGAWVNTSTGALKVSFVSWHRRLLPKQPEGAVDWTHAAWRSDRLPHRAAGTLRWATGGGWGLSTWAPGMDGNRTDMSGDNEPASLQQARTASTTDLSGTSAPASLQQASTASQADLVGSTAPASLQQARNASATDLASDTAPASPQQANTASTTDLASDTAPASLQQASTTSQADLGGSTAPATLQQASTASATDLASDTASADLATPLTGPSCLHSSVMARVALPLTGSDHAHTRQTLLPMRLDALGWSSVAGWALDKSWGQILGSRASTSTT